MNTIRRFCTTRVLTGVTCAVLTAGCIMLLPVFSYGVNDESVPQLPAGAALATRGMVNLLVEQAGEMQSAQNVVYSSNCEWRANLVWIAPEGQYVRPGDVIAQLDVSQLRIKKEERDVRVLRAKADLHQAEAKYEIQKLLNESNSQAASLQAMVAAMELDGYQDATLPMEKMKLEQSIVSAQENLIYLHKRVEYLTDLVNRGYKDQQTLEAERVKLITAQQQLDVANGKMALLTTHQSHRKEVQLTGAERESRRQLERVGTVANAALLSCEANLHSCRRQYELQLLRLARVNRSIEACTIVARDEGEVVHVRNNNTQMAPQPGDEIYFQQQLVKLPDRARMQVVLRLHESVVRHVTTGLPALIKLDALPKQRLAGRVTRVSTIPLQGRWPNVDRREYEVIVRLEDGQPNVDSVIAPGMTAGVRIHVAEHHDVLHVPVSAAVRIAEQDYVFLRAGDSFETRRVTVGLANSEKVEILAGLVEGEEVVKQPLLDCGHDIDQLRDKLFAERNALAGAVVDDAG